MHQTTPEIDYPYPVPSSPYLLHSPAQVLQPSDMKATVCHGLQQSKFSHPAQMENDPQSVSDDLSEKQLAVLPYVVSAPSSV